MRNARYIVLFLLLAACGNNAPSEPVAATQQSGKTESSTATSETMFSNYTDPHKQQIAKDDRSTITLMVMDEAVYAAQMTVHGIADAEVTSTAQYIVFKPFDNRVNISLMGLDKPLIQHSITITGVIIGDLFVTNDLYANYDSVLIPSSVRISLQQK